MDAQRAQRHFILMQPSSWMGREGFVIILPAFLWFGFSVWSALLNNFAIERAAFTGQEIGNLHALREIPGLLAISIILLLLVWREQTVALAAVCLAGGGIALTGFLPSEYGFYFTTILISIGFHYLETLSQSLSLQWISVKRAPIVLGIQAAGWSVGALIAYAFILFMLEFLALEYKMIYLIGGLITLGGGIYMWIAWPRYDSIAVQNKGVVFRKRYWLFYSLTFLSGARRQIFMVFAAFMLVEKFDFDATMIASLYLGNQLITTWIAPRIGRWIARFGERRTLSLQYFGLIMVFSGYAIMDDLWVVVSLYVLDHIFFSFFIAIRSYLQKIADPGDMASTASVSFTINHIAAVGLPPLLGFIWLFSPESVFFIGAGIAFLSLILSVNIPDTPEPGNEVVVGHRGPGMVSAAE